LIVLQRFSAQKSAKATIMSYFSNKTNLVDSLKLTQIELA